MPLQAQSSKTQQDVERYLSFLRERSDQKYKPGPIQVQQAQLLIDLKPLS